MLIWKMWNHFSATGRTPAYIYVIQQLYHFSGISFFQCRNIFFTSKQISTVRHLFALVLALEYIHAHAAQFNINEELFENWNVHVHVPEGAIPKDGPSAGITMVTSLVSAFTQRKVKKNLAMTGEITLRGKVLPVGGIKEKILAAKRAGIKELILCKENEKDINEIKPEYLKGLVFHYVSDIQQVVDLALLREKVDNPLF